MSNNTSLIQVIKQICKQEREASKPADVIVGTVEDGSPLSIRVSPKLILSEPFLIVTETLTERALAAGDKVLMIRADGGQRFLCIDRIGA